MHIKNNNNNNNNDNNNIYNNNKNNNNKSKKIKYFVCVNNNNLYIRTMIKIFIVSIIIMLNEYGLKKSVSTLQKRNYAPKKIKTLASLEI